MAASPAVQVLLDDRGDGQNLGAQFLFHTEQVVAVIIGDQVYGKTQVTIPTRTSHLRISDVTTNKGVWCALSVGLTAKQQLSMV